MELAALLVEPHPETALLVEDVAHVEAAKTRAKVNTMTPIRARSRSPTTVPVSMERSSSPASSAVRMGVLPLPISGVGPSQRAQGCARARLR